MIWCNEEADKQFPLARIYAIVVFLSIVDLFSTLWLNTNLSSGRELNPVMAIALEDTILFIFTKMFFTSIVLMMLYRLKTLSKQAFRPCVFATCFIMGLVCVSNLTGILVVIFSRRLV